MNLVSTVVTSQQIFMVIGSVKTKTSQRKTQSQAVKRRNKPSFQPEALEHLNFAIKEFRYMKMQPSLERALKHKEILGA